jgi:integrase
VRAFVTEQLRSRLHVNTVRKHLHAIKPFYRWAWQQRIMDADSFMRIRDIEAPRGSSARGRPRPYKVAEVQRFWAELDARWPLSTERTLTRFARGTSRYNRVWRHAMFLQTQAVTSLALFGGLRHSEIRHAGIDDIHPDNAYIVVNHAKSPFGVGQGYREVPYTVERRRMVAAWLESRMHGDGRRCPCQHSS